MVYHTFVCLASSASLDVCVPGVGSCWHGDFPSDSNALVDSAARIAYCEDRPTKFSGGMVTPSKDNKTPLAQAAAKEFYDTLRANGKRMDQAQLDLAWNNAVEVVKRNLRTAWMVDGLTRIDVID